MCLHLENSTRKHSTKPIFAGKLFEVSDERDCQYQILLGQVTNFGCSKWDICHCKPLGHCKLLVETGRIVVRGISNSLGLLQNFGGSGGTPETICI